MKILFVIILSIFFQACARHQDNSDSPAHPEPIVKTAETDDFIPDDERNLIIGGEKVKKKEEIDNYVVSIINTQQGTLCTASILTEEFLLTAAHCLSGAPEETKISFSLKTSEKKLRSISSYQIHPYWNKSSQSKNAFDIGIIYFKGGLPSGYEKVNLLPSSYKFQNNQAVELAGYGIKDGEENSGAGILRSVEAKIKEASFSETEILIDQTNQKGACHGDSGGPAFVKLADGKLLYWGITSRGYGPNGKDCEGYSIYTKVMPFRKWINLNAKQMKEK
jgi:secreted trypsin-like serine protease